MANTIKIKRGLSSNIDRVTTTLGELAITTDTDELYVGTESGKAKLNESSLKNIVDGKADGSIRSINAHDETGKLLGKYAQAFGSYTTASGENSHAEGYGADALGNSSHAEGYVAKASGENSHAEGYRTIAAGENQHVQGIYNIADTTSAHIIGNGPAEDNKSNAHTVDWSGNAWFAGDVYTGSTSGKNKDDGSKKLATEEYVNSLIETGTNDNGRYEKYANGMLKCYYTQTISTDIKNSWGSLSISPIIQLQDYPITFKAITSLNMSVVGVNASAWIINGGDFNLYRPCPINLCAANPLNLPNDFRISVCAIGTWK